MLNTANIGMQMRTVSMHSGSLEGLADLLQSGSMLYEMMSFCRLL